MFIKIVKPDLLALNPELISQAADECAIPDLEFCLQNGNLCEPDPEIEYSLIINSSVDIIHKIPDKDKQRSKILRVCKEFSYNHKLVDSQFYVGRVVAPILIELKSGEYYLIDGELQLLLMLHYDIPPTFYWIKQP